MLKLVFGLIFALMTMIENSYADVVLDNNLSLVKNPATQEFDIPQSLGDVSGNNLFHSFSEFDIDIGEVAVFSGTDNIQNIISRISSSSPSTIDGTLKTTIDGANLWLLNPNGILFGETATLDITGSFYTSTANYLRFDNGDEIQIGVFSNADIFSSASPASFRFSDNDASSILINSSRLSVVDGQDINITAGPININDATLNVNNGNIKLLAVNSTAVVPLTNNDIKVTLADINITRSTFSVSGTDNPNIAIIGGKIVISDSFIEAKQTATISISGNNTVISNTTIKAVDQEKIQINSDKLVIRDTDDESIIQSTLTYNNLDIIVDDINQNAFSELLTTTSDSSSNENITINGSLVGNSNVLLPETNNDFQNSVEPSIETSIPSDKTSKIDGQFTDNSIANLTKIDPDNKSPIKSKRLKSEFGVSQNCIIEHNQQILTTRPILFQPMPGEFNPGALYSKVDLSEYNKTNIKNNRRATLGIFNQCG